MAGGQVQDQILVKNQSKIGNSIAIEITHLNLNGAEQVVGEDAGGIDVRQSIAGNLEMGLQTGGGIPIDDLHRNIEPGAGVLFRIAVTAQAEYIQSGLIGRGHKQPARGVDGDVRRNT